MKKFYTTFLILLLVSCTSADNSEATSSDGSQSEEIVFEQGFGKNPSEFVSNWNKLVSEISSDEETLLFFSINPDNVQWTSTDRNMLYYQFGLSENTQSLFVLNILIADDIVEGVEFFSPVANDEVTSQRARLFFLIIIAMSDDSLDKDGRESVLSKVGLYDEVDNPNQIGGGVTINNVRYVVEPLVDQGNLRGISFYSTRVSE
jgi:ribosomal protein L24E